jgi:hypothetical protein
VTLERFLLGIVLEAGWQAARRGIMVHDTALEAAGLALLAHELGVRIKLGEITSRAPAFRATPLRVHPEHGPTWDALRDARTP